MTKIFTTSLFTFLIVLLAITSQAHVQFRVEFTANNTYEVSLLPDTNWMTPLNITNSGAATLVVPTGGFEVNSVTDISGNTIANQASDLNIDTEVLTNSICGASNGSVQLTVNDFSDSYSVEINGDILFENEIQESILIENLAAGDYTIIVTDNLACSVEKVININHEESALNIRTQVVSAPSCGTANGVAQININDFSGSYNITLNGELVFENHQEPIVLLENLAVGNHLIIVTDEFSCSTGTNLSLFASTTTLNVSVEVENMPTCEASNGQLIVSVSDFSNSYEVIINGDVLFTNAEVDTLLIEDLAAGTYDIVINDEAGCSEEASATLENMMTTPLSLEDIDLTHLTCPNDRTGAIESGLDYSLMVFDLDENLIGETPISDLAAGDYLIKDNTTNCSSELVVTINDVTDWVIETTITPATCEGNDGEISIAIDGTNGGYTFAWSPNISTSNVATNLMTDSSYNVTITAINGCFQIIENLFVSMDCEVTCEALFALDTFSVALTDTLTEICLPLNVLDTTGWSYALNDTTYGQPLGTCIESGIFYSYGMLWNVGDAPYRLEFWTYGNDELSDFEFNTIEELIAEMNMHDPLGNWLISNSGNSILGGTTGVSYGNLQITHIESNTTLTLQLNNVSQTRFSISLTGAGQHEFVIQDDTCSDTLIINLLLEEEEEPNIFIAEVIRLELDSCGGVAKLCLPFDNVIDFEIMIDDEPFFDEFLNCGLEASALPFDTGFHEVIITDLINEFSDTVLVNVMCDTLNAPIITPDTIFVQIPVGETAEVCMDITELPGFILSAENICEDPTDEVVDVILDFDECADIISYEVGESQACVVLCNELGFCDTTIVAISVTTNELVIYNGFSPNGDGVNEHFQIDNIELYPNNSLMIFNRWGARVYRTEGYKNREGWTGTFNEDTNLPDGTYFYILDDGEGRVFKGYLDVRR